MCQLRTPLDETAHETLARHRCVRGCCEPEAIWSPSGVLDEFLWRLWFHACPLPRFVRDSPNSERDGYGTEVARRWRRDSGVFQRLSWLVSEWRRPSVEVVFMARVSGSQRVRRERTGIAAFVVGTGRKRAGSRGPTWIVCSSRRGESSTGSRPSSRRSRPSAAE